MKKKLSVLICIATAAAILTSACVYGNPKLAGQDTGYAVTGNGGFAVQYGDYIYFINGTVENYEDAEGKNNKWGEVDKGGLYRVKLGGQERVKKAYEPLFAGFVWPGAGRQERYPQNADEPQIFVSEKDSKLKDGDPFFSFPLQLKTGASFDEDEDEEVAFVDPDSLERVVPKVITFSGDSEAGIFIYEGFIYYASPSIRRNKSGSVEYNFTEFYRTGVDGRKTKRLYASAGDVSQYNFYHYGGKVYLVMNEGGTLRSISIDKNGRTKGKTLEDDVQEVFFPRKPVYYAGINENTAADFVYYTRPVSAKWEDASNTGNILEMRRPDLTDERESGALEGDNTTYRIAGVSCGVSTGTDAKEGPYNIPYNTLFFYASPSFGQTADIEALYALDLTRLIKGEDKLDRSKAKRLIADTSLVSQLQVFTEGSGTMPVALGVQNGELRRWQENGSEKVTDFSGTILALRGQNLYYTVGEALYSAKLSWGENAIFANEPVKITDRDISTDNNFGVDFAGGLIFFLSHHVEQKEFTKEYEFAEGAHAGNYLFCKLEADARAIDDEYFIGVLGAKDLVEEE